MFFYCMCVLRIDGTSAHSDTLSYVRRIRGLPTTCVEKQTLFHTNYKLFHMKIFQQQTQATDYLAMNFSLLLSRNNTIPLTITVEYTSANCPLLHSEDRL